jgi:hypothetical protein
VASARSRAGALLLAALLLPVAARGQEGADPAWEAARAGAAARLSTLGNWCRGRGLKATARRHFADALRLHPEDPNARAGLGYRRGPQGWTDPAVPDRSPDGRLTLDAAVAALAKETLAAHREASRPFLDLARASATAGRVAEARAAWERVLALDPECGAAREALRLEGAERGWLSADGPGPAAAVARFREMARRGAARLPGPDPGEAFTPKRAGLAPSTDLGDARFRVRSYVESAPARELLEGMLAAEAILEGAGVVPPRGPGTPAVAYHLFGSKASYERAIDSRKDRDEAWKRGHKSLAGFWWDTGVYLRWVSFRGQGLETTVHFATHCVVGGAPRETPVPPWMVEGLAHLCSVTLRGRVFTWCATLEGSASRKEMPESEDWDEEAREVVRGGGDPPITTLAVAGYNDLDVDALVKGRSLASWLASNSPGAFARWFEVAATGRKGEDLVREVFGAPPEAVDLRWRLWALRK